MRHGRNHHIRSGSGISRVHRRNEDDVRSDWHRASRDRSTIHRQASIHTSARTSRAIAPSRDEEASGSRIDRHSIRGGVEVLHEADDDCQNFLQRIHIRSADLPHGRPCCDEEVVHNAEHSVSLDETTNARHETSSSPSQRTTL